MYNSLLTGTLRKFAGGAAFHGFSEHFRVWASVPVRVQGARRSSPKGKRGKKVLGDFSIHVQDTCIIIYQNIIIYHDALIVYHCVSSSISSYIMSLVDTRYIVYLLLSF